MVGTVQTQKTGFDCEQSADRERLRKHPEVVGEKPIQIDLRIFFYQCEQPNAIANGSQPFPDMQCGLGLRLILLSAIHRLIQSKQALMREMESDASAMLKVKNQIELSVVGIELDTKAVLSRDCPNGGCRVNSEEDGPQHRTLGCSIVQWLGL